MYLSDKILIKWIYTEVGNKLMSEGLFFHLFNILVINGIAFNCNVDTNLWNNIILIRNLIKWCLIKK